MVVEVPCERHAMICHEHLVGWFFTDPIERYDRQNGKLPEIGMYITKCLKPSPTVVYQPTH